MDVINRGQLRDVLVLDALVRLALNDENTISRPVRLPSISSFSRSPPSCRSTTCAVPMWRDMTPLPPVIASSLDLLKTLTPREP